MEKCQLKEIFVFSLSDTPVGHCYKLRWCFENWHLRRKTGMTFTSSKFMAKELGERLINCLEGKFA